MRLSTKVVALAIACVLGLGAGAAAAVLVDDSRPTAKEPPLVDPLGLGVDLVNLECTGQKLMVIAWGDAAAALDSSIADNRDSAAYLRTADSCDTIFGGEDRPTPEYAAYVGPFDSFSEVCERRMTVQHRGDVVTVLTSGNTQLVRCPCHLNDETFPVLRPGMAPDEVNTLWARALQQLLVDIDPELFPRSKVSGFYDEATEARVRELQDHVGETGVVDAATWRSITNQVCGTYTY